MPTELEDYLFDLRGYLILEHAIDQNHLSALNATIDALLPIKGDTWQGHVYARHDNAFFNVTEAGEPFERLIDHPTWIEHARRYIGEEESGLFIDESFVDIRGPGIATRMHGGGHKRKTRAQFRYHNGFFRCGQINILLALNDIGPGDGATMVIPSSHKANLLHPAFNDPAVADKEGAVDGVENAIEVHLKAGDALLCVDAIAHGSARRVNPGERRLLCYRYGPKWGRDRYGFYPSDELLARLSPARRKILEPVAPLRPPRD